MSGVQTIRVVELAGSIGVAWAGRLFADCGADVVRVGRASSGERWEEHGGTALGAVIHAGKRCAAEADTAALIDLLAGTDVLIHDLPEAAAGALQLAAPELLSRFPNLVVLAITPFGGDGPRCRWTATDLIVANAGGWAHLCPATHSDPELAPLKVAGHQCGLMAATAGVTAALASVFRVRAGGGGDYIDLAEQAYVASVLEAGVPAASYRGEDVARYHPRSLIPWGIFEAADAPVFLVCIEQDQWERLVEFMGSPEWASLEVFADQTSRAENQDLVHTFVAEFVAQWKAEDLWHAAQQRRIPVAPVYSFRQLLNDQHLQARDFLQTLNVDAGTPGSDSRTLRVPRTPVLSSRYGRGAPLRPPTPVSASELNWPARRLRREATSATRPLKGIRVLDLTWAWAGPFCSMNLAHLGAEVIRVESEERPDLYRRLPFFDPELEPGLNRSGMFNQWNQGKQSVAVSLRTAEGAELVRRLAACCDVVVQNFSTGVLERLGLDFPALSGRNPKLIMASISGYGQSGPLKNYAGYGPVAAALSGLCASTGYLGGQAEELGLSMPDPTSGITAAMGICAALLRREVDGVGEHLDVSLWEATAALAVEGWVQYQAEGVEPERLGNRDRHMAPHGCFRCVGDDGWLAIACADEVAWRALAQHLSIDDPRFETLAGRKAHEDALDALLGHWCAGRDAQQAAAELQLAGVAASACQSPAQVLADPQLGARGFVERLPHPEVGHRAHTGVPWKLLRGPNGVQQSAPCLGADTDDVLLRVLDCTPAEIAELRRVGAIS